MSIVVRLDWCDAKFIQYSCSSRFDVDGSSSNVLAGLPRKYWGPMTPTSEEPCFLDVSTGESLGGAIFLIAQSVLVGNDISASRDVEVLTLERPYWGIELHFPSRRGSDLRWLWCCFECFVPIVGPSSVVVVRTGLMNMVRRLDWTDVHLFNKHRRWHQYSLAVS